MTIQSGKTFMGDSRWGAVKAMNGWNDKGMAFPASVVREDAYCLAYKIKSETRMNYPELGEFMCPGIDRRRAGSRVWNWVEQGRAITSLRQR